MTTRATLRPFRTPVRGHAFAAAPGRASAPEAGARARLFREPGNPADALAVAVWVEASDSAPWRIGYLDRGVAARVAPRIDAGLALDAEVDGWISEPDGRWHRPLVLILPEQPERASREPEPLRGRPPGVSRRVVRGR